MATFKGTVKKNELEGGFWELHSGKDRYQLDGGDPGLHVEGLQVEITGEVDKGGFGIGMTGPILKVTSYKKI